MGLWRRCFVEHEFKWLPHSFAIARCFIHLFLDKIHTEFGGKFHIVYSRSDDKGIERRAERSHQLRLGDPQR
jgi:hypothetical protein